MLSVLIRIASSRRFKWVHSTYNYFIEDWKDIPELSPAASWPGAMINPQWLELPLSRTNFNSPKDLHVIEVWLYDRMNCEVWSPLAFRRLFLNMEQQPLPHYEQCKDDKQTLFFQSTLVNRIWYFMQIVSWGDNKHEMSNPIFWEK